MCLDSVACVRRQPGGGTTLFQGFVTMPISEVRTSDNPCYLFAQHTHRKISFGSAQVVAHLSASAMWTEEELPTGTMQ